MEHLVRSRVRKLSLVKLQHTDRSFDSVVSYMQRNPHLKEIDLSWSSVRPALMLRLLKEISQNSTLVSLSLAYNRLLEEQATTLTEEQEAAGVTEVELSAFNKEVVACFHDFVKYDVYLVHLDLTMTGLIEPAVKNIASLLTRSQSLRCLHLCGNKGVSEETVEWIKRRVHGAYHEEPLVVPPSKT